jgi:hypothetical protein
VMEVLNVFRQEGRVEALLEQLTARFGSVPAAVKARIKSAKEAELSRWSLQVLTAPTLEAVLSEPARKSAKVSRSAGRK